MRGATAHDWPVGNTCGRRAGRRAAYLLCCASVASRRNTRPGHKWGARSQHYIPSTGLRSPARGEGGVAYGNGLVRLDHANLLRGRPAPTTLNRGDDLNAIGRIGHRHGCMPHTCQVGDRVRSVRGLSQSVHRATPWEPPSWIF